MRGVRDGSRRSRLGPNAPGLSDVLAGVSVALVLIPQSLAYAELAGMPAATGLHAAALPLIVAAFFASSPYLQTGPVALTSLLTFGALSPLAPPGSSYYTALAALLAVGVGLVRVLVGLLNAGVIAYLLAQPVMAGFTSAAGILIIASQLPGAFGVSPPLEGVLQGAVWTLINVRLWNPSAIVLAITTGAVILIGRRIHPLVPGVLVATAIGIAYSKLAGYSGPTVGAVDAGLPTISLDLPWTRLPALLPAATIIALAGFAEPASIARAFATQDRRIWNPNKEFVSQGMANLVAGVVQAFPVGGSFSRSSLNRLAGARTRWSGAVTGIAVLAFLPFAWIVQPLPIAVLSGIVITAVAGLVRFRPILEMWSLSIPQFVIGAGTFILTLALAPHIEWAVVLGIIAAIGVHLWRELDLFVEIWTEGTTAHVKPHGVLWFGSAASLERPFQRLLAESPQLTRLVLHAGGLGRVDLTGAQLLTRLLEDAEATGLEVRIVEVHPRTGKVFARMLEKRLSPQASPPGGARTAAGRADDRPPAGSGTPAP